jgi:tRNA dimethylallyltransferase
MVPSKVDMLAIIGPTASGKSDLAIGIAKKYNGEIITADSRTVYKYMDIGTAKPTKLDQEAVKHWGLNLVGPGEKFTVADFQNFVKRAKEDINKRGKLPIIVGGSGLYVDAVLYDFGFAKPNRSLRERYKEYGAEDLQKKLKRKHIPFPENKQNKRYLLNALERNGNRPVKGGLAKNTYIIGLNPPKDVLESRIAKRIDEMIKNGLVSEIESVINMYGKESEQMKSGVYRVFINHNNDFRSKAIISDLQLARKQMTWFKRNKDITWFEDKYLAETWIDNLFGGKL